MKTVVENSDLRKQIVKMVYRSQEGHIPSAFSIVDIIHYLYESVLNYDSQNPKAENRDSFILSKGHGASALYAVLHKFGFLSDQDLFSYSKKGGILGGHPDATCVPGAEASTGSLGHGFPFAVGLALGLKIQSKPNRVFCLMGDGECNEGTIWEAALVAKKQQLGNLVGIVDLNGSAAQILPVDPLLKKWEAFGWRTSEVNGHDSNELRDTFSKLTYHPHDTPQMIIANTIKGKGVDFIEGHGKWHHKIPTEAEYEEIMKSLS